MTQEEKDNASFEEWIESEYFKMLPQYKKEDLMLYVAGLNSIISDLREGKNG